MGHNHENRPRLFYFGHHKCASQWIIAILKQACEHMGLRCKSVVFPDEFGRNLDLYVREHKIDFLFYGAADWRYVEGLQNFRAFHVIRDPRDVCVSAYFSHLYSHPTDSAPWLLEFRKKLTQMSQNKAIEEEINFCSYQLFRQMESWNYQHPDILELKFEDLTATPNEYFLSIFLFLGLIDQSSSHPDNTKFITPATLQHIVDKHRFSKKSGGRKRGEEDPKSHYRKGIVGDWNNYFTPEHIELFSKNNLDLLDKLGYA